MAGIVLRCRRRRGNGDVQHRGVHPRLCRVVLPVRAVPQVVSPALRALRAVCCVLCALPQVVSPALRALRAACLGLAALFGALAGAATGLSSCRLSCAFGPFASSQVIAAPVFDSHTPSPIPASPHSPPLARPLYLSTKNTILKKYDGRFMQARGRRRCSCGWAGWLGGAVEAVLPLPGALRSTLTVRAPAPASAWCTMPRALTGHAPGPASVKLCGQIGLVKPPAGQPLQIFDEIYRTKYQSQFENLGIW